jgi:pyruvate/2-oxoglutarate dehydrogenase complex dihydrolipoamide acyltransferase (E2) component
MLSPVSSASTQAVAPASTNTQAAAQPAKTAAPAESPTTSSTPTDTVTLSSAAQALAKEMSETPAQTAKEAAVGDHQAQRLLAKEMAARHTG